jgi:predicted metalloendopeptidase
MRIKLDPHALEEVRGTVPEMNLAPLYDAFGVKGGDKMYLRPGATGHHLVTGPITK